MREITLGKALAIPGTLWKEYGGAGFFTDEEGRDIRVVSCMPNFQLLLQESVEDRCSELFVVAATPSKSDSLDPNRVLARFSVIVAHDATTMKPAKLLMKGITKASLSALLPIARVIAEMNVKFTEAANALAIEDPDILNTA